jgi:hypothetical protein
MMVPSERAGVLPNIGLRVFDMDVTLGALTVASPGGSRSLL